MKKKLKNNFDHRPVPSHPIPSNSGFALAVRLALDPEGDWKVTGNEERNQLPFYFGNRFKN